MAACAKAPPLADLPLSKQDDTLVRTDAGAYVGGISENKARTWLGIPYAKPPIGDLRWRATEPLPYQDSTRTALQHANWCPQLTNGLDGLFGIPKGELRGNEDCLYLDIYAPSDATSRSNLPVMFWIHGGSNVWGRTAQYDGSALAQSENVIVVVVQYRLGPLGWFAHPALEDGIANFALLDLVQALKWTRQNIRNFGGDPDAVTLFGESAGANNVPLQATSLARTCR
jgi:para-nitrobenzyl esterase